MDKKAMVCLAALVVLVASRARADSVLFGNVGITSGSAEESDAVSEEFTISGPGFSATSASTPDWDFQISIPPPGTPLPAPIDTCCHLGINGSFSEGSQGLTLSLTGQIPTWSSSFFDSCDPTGSSGTYMGVQSACLGPVGMGAAGSNPGPREGISFSGTATVLPDDSAAFGTFTATGELIGYSPAFCGQTGSCTEDFDVTFSGQGTLALYAPPGDPYFFRIALDFTPTSTPETPTVTSFGLGLLSLAAFGLCKRLRDRAYGRSTAR